MHLLVVDDDSTTLRVLSRLLQRKLHPASLSKARDGQAAVDLVLAALGGEGQLPTHVTLDNSMPVLSGVDAVQKMREAGYTGHVVGLTGNAIGSDRAEFLEAGADVVVTKPAEWATLEQALGVSSGASSSLECASSLPAGTRSLG